MKQYTKTEVQKVLSHYDADHDIGVGAPVTWREERLAVAILEMSDELETLKKKVNSLFDAVPSARRDFARIES